MLTLQQEFAANVYAHVRAYKDEHSDENDPACQKYGGMAMRLPVLVRSAGLVQALAFVEMKTRGEDRSPYGDLLGHLSQVVLGPEQRSLSEASRSAELQEYIHLTRRTLIALDWFRRFSQSILKMKTTDSGEGA